MVARTSPAKDGGLWVTLTRAHDTIEIDRAHVKDEREAMKAALSMLLLLDELWEGDKLTVTRAAGNDNKPLR
jgi:hypothetical protein